MLRHVTVKTVYSCISTVYSIGVINASTMIHHAATLVLHIVCFALHEFTVARLAQQNDGGQVSADQTCA